MIRLFYSLFDIPIEIKENEVNVIVLERSGSFREFMFEVKKSLHKFDSKIKLSKNYEEISFEKHIYPVFSIEGIDVNSKRILAKVHSDLKEYAFSEGMYEKTMQIIHQVYNYSDNLLHQSELNLIYDDLDMDTFLKAVSIKINTDEEDFIQMICDFIDVVSEVFHIQIFMFFHLKEYLEEEEMIELYNHCNYRHINIIVIENSLKAKLPFEIITIIDRDLCQVT